MLALGRLMALAALRRTESRGVHYRRDHPRTDDRRWRAHLVLRRHGIKRDKI
jgi:succinate dehydrogenase/fumarate reductase flavoprotein subunit